MFHRLCDKKKDSKIPGTITKKNIEDIIKFVNPKNILNPLVWLNKSKKNQLKKNDLCLTFDDGLLSQKKIALPILNKYGLKAFWFVHTQHFYKKFDNNEIFTKVIFNKFKNFKIFFKEYSLFNKLDLKIFNSKEFYEYFKIQKKYCKYYSMEEVQYRYLRDFYFTRKKHEKLMINFFLKKNINLSKESKKIWLSKKDISYLCKNNHVIGLHSFSHPSQISQLSNKSQEREYRKNLYSLNSICHKEITSMAHPMNSYNSNTFKVLKKLGIACGFKADTSKELGLKKDNKNLVFKRIDVAEILDQM